MKNTNIWMVLLGLFFSQNLLAQLTANTTVTSNFNGADVSCYGSSDGDATATASGGTAPYTFLWGPSAGGQTAAIATGLAAGVHFVTATDNVGATATASVTLTEPTAVSATISSSTNVSCFGANDGTATVVASGGVNTIYTYSWSHGSTTPNESNLAAGTYCVTVTDVNGCEASTCVTIAQPTAVVATISSQTNVSVQGGNDGSATASATGGAPPYAWDWGAGYSLNATVTGLSAGTYCVTVIEGNGCTASNCVTITEPSSSLNSTITSITNVTCNGGMDGTATISSTGGTSPYHYLWSVGGVSAATITGMSAGIYTVTTTDNVGATVTTNVIITEPAALTLNASAGNNVSCFGACDGTVTSSVSGGVPPFSYNWDNGGVPICQAVSCSALCPGVYGLTVTDMNGCMATSSVVITQPSTLTVSISNQINVTCNGGADGSLTATASGGLGGYSYLWNQGSATATISGLSAWVYCVTVVDANGCLGTACATITEPSLTFNDNSYLVAPDSTLSFCVQPAAATSITILQNSTFGSLTANGTGCYTYTPSALPELSDTIIIEACDGIQTIQNTIIIGIAGCVWAGDTDTNQVVNNFDLLPIGINYGMAGPIRPNADLNWDCEPMWNWNALPSGQPDPKHSDSNGDGIVNSDDTLAITQNWGQLYLRDGGGDNPHGTGVPLYIDTATTSPGDTILLPIVLGAAAFPATTAYGIAFTVTYDNSIVDTNSIHLLYNNSWLGIDNVDMISIEKDFYFQGKTEIGMTRIDHTTRSGSGPIAHIQLTIKDDVLKQLNRRLDFNITNVRLIDSVGNEIPVAAEASSVLILTTGVERIEKTELVDFEIFPNPSSGQFSIALSDAIGPVDVSIYNALGQLVKQEQHSAQNTLNIDFDALPGIYFVQVRNEKGELGLRRLTLR